MTKHKIKLLYNCDILNLFKKRDGVSMIMDKEKIGKITIRLIALYSIILSILFQIVNQNHMIMLELAYVQLTIFAIAAIMMIVIWFIFLKK